MMQRQIIGKASAHAVSNNLIFPAREFVTLYLKQESPNLSRLGVILILSSIREELIARIKCLNQALFVMN
jgi:hypothetical protein